MVSKTLSAMCLLTFVSCTESENLTSGQRAQQGLEAPTGLASYDAGRVRRTAGEIAERVLTLAALVDPKTSASHERIASVFESTPKLVIEPAWFVRPFPENSNLVVAYHLNADDLRVSNRSLTQDYESPASVDEGQARELFHEAFEALASSGVIDRTHYDLAREHVGYTKHGSGSTIDGVTRESEPQVSEYHFRVRRLIDNIEFANQLLKISVHVTGRISSVRVVSAEVGARQGSLKARVLSDADLKSRFSRDYPNGYAEWDQVLYSFPGDENSGVIEPKHVFSFSNVTMSDGEPVVSRRQEVRYSVTSSEAEPEIWPVPKPDAVGDQTPER